MGNTITGTTRGGAEWTPAFVQTLNQNNCIGCGRCFKVCPRDVFELVERDSIEGLEDKIDDDDDDDDDETMVMNLMNAMDCIGCQACSKVCPKKCFSHEPAQAA